MLLSFSIGKQRVTLSLDPLIGPIMPDAISIKDIVAAKQRIDCFVHPTPILESSLLNQLLGHRILFKVESMQRTGSFKLRGASNMLATLKEQGQLPQQVLANSSGNHAQAVALAAQLFGIKAKIYSTKSISAVKAAATPAVGSYTFPILQQLDALFEVEEEKIAYWTQWLQHLLKIHVEPTSAMSMAAVVAWLQMKPQRQKVLVILSGGNIDQQKMLSIWQQDHLQLLPSLSS